MSKQAIIGINGSLTPFSETVDKLRTPGIGGSDIIWVPEDQTRCESLRVTANGTYAAASAGKYGYNYVTVSVAGDSVTGKDGDGDEATATPDPDTGIIVYTKIPSSIEITTLPTKQTYTDGETIDYTGIVVKAYYENSGEWGTVPYNELVFPVTTADAGEARPVEYEATYSNTSALHNPEYLNQPLCYVGSGQFHFNTIRDNDPSAASSVERKYIIPPGVIGILFLKPNAGWSLLFMSTASNKSVLQKWRWGSMDYYNDNTFLLASTTETVNGITVYYAYESGGFVEGITVSSNYPDNNYGSQSYSDPTGGNGLQDIATVIFDGKSSISGGGQVIPVNWPRPGDGAILETSFNIIVTPASQEG